MTRRLLLSLVSFLLSYSTIAQPSLYQYCFATTTAGEKVKGLCGGVSFSGDFITQITIRDSLNRKIKLSAGDIMRLVSTVKPYSIGQAINENTGIIFEPLPINSKTRLGQLINWEAPARMKLFAGPFEERSAVPKGLFGLNNGLQYEEATFWVYKPDTEPVLLSRKNFESNLSALFADCPSFYEPFIKTKPRYTFLLTYINDYNRLCSENWNR